MAAYFPRQVRTFATRHDFTDTVLAADPNALADEVTAIETSLGINPQVSVMPDPSVYKPTAQVFNNISDRISNVEAGVSSDAHSQYFRRAGDVIAVQSTTRDALTITLPAGYTARPIRVTNSAGGLLLELDSSGDLTVAGTINGNMSTNNTKGITIVNSLPTTGAYDGQTVLVRPNFSMWVWDLGAGFWHAETRRDGTTLYNPGVWTVIFQAPSPNPPIIVDGNLTGLYEILSPTLMFVRINYQVGQYDFTGDTWVNLAFGLPFVNGRMVQPAQYAAQEQVVSGSVIHNSVLRGDLSLGLVTGLHQFGYSAGAPDYGIIPQGIGPLVVGDTVNMQGIITTQPMYRV